MEKIFKNCIRTITCRKPPLPESRNIYINKDFFNEDDSYVPYEYSANEILSSKYTILNFIPKNLFEQFQRIANFYFILIMLVQLLIDSPVSAYTTIVPIVFVLLVTMVKQGIEDVMRHKSDNEVNMRKFDVLKENQFESINSSQILVGDIVKCYTGHSFPCDLVLLATSESSGECTVTTANLDGETSLKTLVCYEETNILNFTNINKTSIKINCTQPEEDLYTFHGSIDIHKEKNKYSYPLSAKNLLLRGMVLKNTEYIIGCTVYTGQDTKLSLNSKGKRMKYSRVELKLNYYLIAYFVILFLFSLICMICLYVYRSMRNEMIGAWYLPSANITAWKTTQEMFGFIVIYNYLIPISLYVSIEIQKFSGAFFIRYDLEMFDAVGDNRARANTSDLNEELGQINYLFSDKTGTLTENDMQFRRCSIGGIQYIDVDSQLCKMSLEENGLDEVLLWPYDQSVTFFLIFLAVCHTVRVDRKSSVDPKPQATTTNGFIGPMGDGDMISKDGYDYEYQASSPDEKAFVEASRRYGVIYHGIINGLHSITVNGKMITYKILDVFEFDSDRKCMSVIVDYFDGTIRLFCKGAESSMLPKASKSSESVSNDKIMSHINEYAENGLRTLVFGHKILAKQEAESILEEVKSCKKSLHDSETLLANLYKKVESNLILIGCSGVEDRLQDGVKETLIDLRTAGIKVWVLTGDKEETAVNISYSAGHFSSSMQEMRLTKFRNLDDARRSLENQLERIETASTFVKDAAYCLIVDGAALKYLLEPALEDDFIQLCMQVSTVLCCRMTPLQKAEIVALIKENVKPEPVTAAIGDGGNDVSMIQEAHVGLGIFGKEGRQAVRAADYAFGKFRFLRRLILMHGHFYYSRITNLIQYFFYKNLVFIAPQFYFAFINLYSAQPIYYTYILALYNVTFTTLPVLLYGVFEQCLSKRELMAKPYLYKINKDNFILKVSNFVKWNINGVWHSLLIFLGIYTFTYLNGSVCSQDGRNNPLEFFGEIVFILVWIIVNVKLYLITYHFNAAILIGFLIILIGNSILFIIFSYIDQTAIFYYLINELCSQPFFWVAIFIITILALIPDIIMRCVADIRISDLLRMPDIRHKKPKRRISYIPSRQGENNNSNENDDGGFKNFVSDKNLTKNGYSNPSYE